MKNLFALLFLLVFLGAADRLCAQQLFGTVQDEAHEAVSEASIFINPTGRLLHTDRHGRFETQKLLEGKYQITVFKEGYTRIDTLVELRQSSMQLAFRLTALSSTLETVVVEAEQEQSAMRSLRKVEGTAIYAAKKTEVIQLEQVLANKASNNARQIYKGIAGLNIWETDGAGLQLNIGARGLDPIRSSNFNTRQNGYDISADALGYPESYYTPPTQALKRIEIVRGAASLQYGPQFGGLLNFVFKEPAKKVLALESEQSIGSNRFFSTFNRVSGTISGFGYSAFLQHKQGDAWRANSEFEQQTAYLSLEKDLGKLELRAEYTYMQYLAQQAGGLLDFEFPGMAQESKRNRNWFKVNWNLAALHADVQISEKTKLNNRSFVLSAERAALGELGPINRPDPLRERDLILGQYRNFGNETRLISRYKLADRMSTALVGLRYYQGHTSNDQGEANDSAEPDFYFLNPEDLEKSSYEFPSRNISVFAENLIQVSPRLSITPGARFEYIKTAAEGYFKQRVFSGGELIFEQRFDEDKSSTRSLLLLGFGLAYQLTESVEAYANASQNYRSINFSDLTVVNPNLVIDSLMRDERGYNLDLGTRGKAYEGRLRFDGSLFLLSYSDRIGIGEIIVDDPAIGEKALAFRSNIGDAIIYGLESYAELDLLSKLMKNKGRQSLFLNLSLLSGKYRNASSAIDGNRVELVPPLSIKTGYNITWKGFSLAYQFSLVGEHFTDATNAIQVSDATRGIIPQYHVHDLSMAYTYRAFSLQANINNLLNTRYFTRRASGYPGPGIIPAEGRTVQFSLGLKL